MLHTDYRRFACPICGEMPHIMGTEYYKAFCNGNSTHVSCGGWFPTKLDAWRDWKKRRVDRNQPDFWYVSNGSKLFGSHYNTAHTRLPLIPSGSLQACTTKTERRFLRAILLAIMALSTRLSLKTEVIAAILVSSWATTKRGLSV